MPSPKERSSTMDSVPQAMASTVRRDALAVAGGVARKSCQTRASSARAHAQESFRATTGSSSEARRAGK